MSDGKCRGCGTGWGSSEWFRIGFCPLCAEFRDSIARPLIIELASHWAKRPAMYWVPAKKRVESSRSLLPEYVDGGDPKLIDPPKPADLAKRWAEIACAAADAALEERRKGR